MLTIQIQDSEFFNESNNEFIKIKSQKLKLEHSLVSISKWEARYKKPFLSKERKSYEETIYYIKCMTITQNVDPNTYYGIDDKIMKEITSYIEDSMTATTFSKMQNGPSHGREIITSELIYYWMIALNIPFECQKWHLNRLLTLIKVCNIKNTPPKKMSTNDLIARNKALNSSRRKAMHSHG